MIDNSRWPTDEFGRFERGFARYLAPHSAELSRLGAAVKARKHPWGYILFASLICAIGATAYMWKIADILGYITFAIGAAAVIYAAKTNSEKSKALKQALSAVDHYTRNDIMLVQTVNPLETDPDILSRYQAFNVFGSYDDIQTIHAYVPLLDDMNAVIDPIFTYADLTRTETETYTDSQGRTQTRTRTVNVFKGILFDMAFPDTDGPARTIISTRRIGRPREVFERRVNGKRIKMDTIKPASLEFQKLYKVKCDDETLGHHILEPDRVMRFIHLYHDLKAEFGKGVDMTMLIMDGRTWVGIETGVLKGIQHRAGKIDNIAPALTKFARQLSTRHILASHLKLPQAPSFPWQGGPDNTV